ncbi:MAG: 16S rRNA (cytosine(967)-C(5))-methyltransferase RsmB, partial [Anaerolineae bacterium]|nr:16S rRNA (cytosine(967)-C(5))-methyltransferase RsmB [Anaerolineae bacterium]NIN99475.1 16S rRNA (cytosine(967)-C(5))-methyltransferase RsmB [Anaerolineae bacterium]NIQ82340.1 16S rRNA (cytosine(967)-C(5))-methyltransferase RsmB [Anaerolineae bacterium]
VCAAPGAKTALMAFLMRNKGRIISVDSSPRRLQTLEKNVRRVGVDIVHPLLADATKPLPARRTMDLVLVDPPCSGTGIYWRAPAQK